MCCTTPSTNEVLIQRHDTQALDASVLLAPLLGLLRSDDERVCQTVPVRGKALDSSIPARKPDCRLRETDPSVMGGGSRCAGGGQSADTLEHAIWTRRQAGIKTSPG